MNRIVQLLLLTSNLLSSYSFVGTRNCESFRASKTCFNAVPLELEGKIDPSKVWEVELTLDGETKTATINEGTSVLEAAESTFTDPPFSCRNGVCTTCSGFIQEGKDNCLLAVHGLGKDLVDEGYTLTCQTFPVGPGVKILLNQYDKVYYEQYGKYERLEVVSDGDKKKKIFGLF
mmetsp:Transcript_15532/g.23137  ORF Transcript_15532/g.23137 Transcript_15532/m.23137 type:complete len:175 (+) Transcript_15532:41-565(+)